MFVTHNITKKGNCCLPKTFQTKCIASAQLLYVKFGFNYFSSSIPKEEAAVSTYDVNVSFFPTIVFNQNKPFNSDIYFMASVLIYIFLFVFVKCK